MFSRSSRTAIMAGAVLALTACAGQVPGPVAAAAPPALDGPPIKLRPVARARRTDPCQPVKVSLPQDRKEALFRQFDAELGPVAASVPAPAAAPAPGPECRQAARHPARQPARQSMRQSPPPSANAAAPGSAPEPARQAAQ